MANHFVHGFKISFGILDFVAHSTGSLGLVPRSNLAASIFMARSPNAIGRIHGKMPFELNAFQEKAFDGSILGSVSIPSSDEESNADPCPYPRAVFAIVQQLMAGEQAAADAATADAAAAEEVVWLNNNDGANGRRPNRRDSQSDDLSDDGSNVGVDNNPNSGDQSVGHARYVPGVATGTLGATEPCDASLIWAILRQSSTGIMFTPPHRTTSPALEPLLMA